MTRCLLRSFRCLGGLWNIPKGSITKPPQEKSGEEQAVFYLPQKPVR